MMVCCYLHIPEEESMRIITGTILPPLSVSHMCINISMMCTLTV